MTVADVRPVTAEILLEAADLIERHGHISGDFGDPERGFCAMGAISWAVWDSFAGLADENDVQNAQEAVFDALEETEGPGLSIGYYNDSHSQTEVIELLHHAAKAVTA